MKIIFFWDLYTDGDEATWEGKGIDSFTESGGKVDKTVEVMISHAQKITVTNFHSPDALLRVMIWL